MDWWIGCVGCSFGGSGRGPLGCVGWVDWLVDRGVSLVGAFFLGGEEGWEGGWDDVDVADLFVEIGVVGGFCIWCINA